MASTNTTSPNEYIVDYGSWKATLQTGWISSPNGRGTIDIIWSCFFLVFLSSWSILCLNLPGDEDSFWRRYWRKFVWAALTVLGPEVVFQRALGEWLIAHRFTKKIRKRHPNWTMTHSFYASMGGIKLAPSDPSAPDEPTRPFPISLPQLDFLLQHNYVNYPSIEKRAILDKNKVDGFLRVLTLGQILWFLINSCGRWHQKLAITTLELSTLAFIFPALGTFFCWFHKPMDIETPSVIHLRTQTLTNIRSQHGHNGRWIMTPLEFVDGEREWPWNIYWHWGMSFMGKIMKLDGFLLQPKERPIERIPDDYWPRPTVWSLPPLFLIHVGYAGVLMAGWNLELPSSTELLLWRIASGIQLGTIVSGWCTMPIQIIRDYLRGWVESYTWFRLPGFFKERLKKRESPDQEAGIQRRSGRRERLRMLNGDDPNWRASLRLLVVYEVTWITYLIARLYIIAEDGASLRAMPPTAFDTVDWSRYMPHL